MRLVLLGLMVLMVLLVGVTTLAAQPPQQFAADLDRFQVLNNESFSTATGSAQFTLRETPSGPQIEYALQLFGLDIEPVAGNRNDPNDVVGIHMHLHVPDVIGPHILNIFGMPGEDDADLVVRRHALVEADHDLVARGDDGLRGLATVGLD